MLRFGIYLSLLVLLFTGCQSSNETSTIYLVRHAEKDLTDTTDNPELTQAGYDRAKQLVKEMNGVSIDGIYTTKYQRNVNTVKPLADEHNLPLNYYEWYEWHGMLDQMTKQPGNTYLICGHGDNLLPMIKYLTGEQPLEKLDKHEYDNLFKVEFSNEDARTEIKKY